MVLMTKETRNSQGQYCLAKVDGNHKVFEEFSTEKTLKRKARWKGSDEKGLPCKFETTDPYLRYSNYLGANLSLSTCIQKPAVFCFESQRIGEFGGHDMVTD